MNKDLLKENLPWADKYRITLKNKGIDDKYALWYLRRADAFMKEVGYSDPGDATREVVEGYFSELGRQNRLENWQFRQVVDAIRILVLDLTSKGSSKGSPIIGFGQTPRSIISEGNRPKADSNSLP